MSDGSEGSGAFVGRDGPRARIRAAFRDSLTGGARLVLVSGEAGIGKTALLTEAVLEAAGAGATTAWATCWDADRGTRLLALGPGGAPDAGPVGGRDPRFDERR